VEAGAALEGWLADVVAAEAEAEAEGAGEGSGQGVVEEKEKEEGARAGAKPGAGRLKVLSLSGHALGPERIRAIRKLARAIRVEVFE